MKNHSSTLLRRTSSRQGFTLMEMMLVLAIIAVIVGIAVQGIMGASDQGDLTKAQITVSSLETKLTQFKLNALRFPTQGEGLEALVKKPGGLTKPWIKSMEEENLIDPWGEKYQYRNPNKRSTKSYDIYSKGPDKQDGTNDDIGNWQ